MVTVLEPDRDKYNSARNLVESSLDVSYGTAQTASCGRITDPVILPNKGRGFLLSGTELDPQHIDGQLRIWEHWRVWQLVPTERHGTE